MSAPVLTIIAGSNGCGKSTLTTYARDEFLELPVLDPDAVGRSLQDLLPAEASDIEAGRRVLALAERLLARLEGFSVETTLSGNTYLKMAARAKDAGFRVNAVLVGTSSVEINIARVRARVEKGGHDVMEEDQRRRWPRTLANMKKLLKAADSAVVIDNSSPQGFMLVGYGVEAMHWKEPLPGWAGQLRG